MCGTLQGFLSETLWGFSFETPLAERYHHRHRRPAKTVIFLSRTWKIYRHVIPECAGLVFLAVYLLVFLAAYLVVTEYFGKLDLDCVARQLGYKLGCWVGSCTGKMSKT